MPAKWQQWIPLHIDKWRGSPAVKAMHPSARSGYLDLILAQWQTEDCAIPSDAISLADLSGLGDELWAVHEARILRNFEQLPDGKLRNVVCFEEWKDAKRVFEKRSLAANRTNESRSPSGHRKEIERSPSRSADTRTTVVNVPVSVPVSVPDSVDTRILSESVGIFGMREQADMNRLLAVHVKESGRGVEGSIKHMIERWELYQKTIPSLEWRHGSSYKFFMSGDWDKPETWPRKKGAVTPSNPGVNFEQRELTEAESYAMWQGMSEQFKRENPWEGGN